MRSIFVLIALAAGAVAVGVESQTELERRGGVRRGPGGRGRPGRGPPGGRGGPGKGLLGLRPKREAPEEDDIPCGDDAAEWTTNWWAKDCDCIQMTITTCSGRPVWNQLEKLDDTAACEAIEAECPHEDSDDEDDE